MSLSSLVPTSFLEGSPSPQPTSNSAQSQQLRQQGQSTSNLVTTVQIPLYVQPALNAKDFFVAVPLPVANATTEEFITEALEKVFGAGFSTNGTAAWELWETEFIKGEIDDDDFLIDSTMSSNESNEADISGQTVNSNPTTIHRKFHRLLPSSELPFVTFLSWRHRQRPAENMNFLLKPVTPSLFDDSSDSGISTSSGYMSPSGTIGSGILKKEQYKNLPLEKLYRRLELLEREEERAVAEVRRRYRELKREIGMKIIGRF